MSQKEDNAQLKKKGKKKKAKTTVTWHNIKCKGSRQNIKASVPVYNFNKIKQGGMTCYFGPHPKASAPETVNDNPIDLSDEGDD